MGYIDKYAIVRLYKKVYKPLIVVFIILSIPLTVHAVTINGKFNAMKNAKPTVNKEFVPYSVPEQGDADMAIKPEDISVDDNFIITTQQGYFIVHGIKDDVSSRFYGIIPAGWQTIRVPNPPPGTRGVISPVGAKAGTYLYRPNVMIGLSIVDGEPRELVKDSSGIAKHSVPGAQWVKQKDGKDSQGLPTALYRGTWTINTTKIQGYGYVSAAKCENVKRFLFNCKEGQSYLFTVIMSSSDTTKDIGFDKERWNFQTNAILNSLGSF